MKSLLVSMSKRDQLQFFGGWGAVTLHSSCPVIVTVAMTGHEENVRRTPAIIWSKLGLLLSLCRADSALISELGERRSFPSEMRLWSTHKNKMLSGSCGSLPSETTASCDGHIVTKTSFVVSHPLQRQKRSSKDVFDRLL